MYKNLAILATKALISTTKRNAGHSKWANIRHIKGAKDAERSALFTKIGRQIKVAIAEGASSDPKKNLKLENVIEQAKRVNMPVATIQSVIKSCISDKSNAKATMLEINGPGGCVILCEVFTSNLQALKITHINTMLRKHQCKLSEGGVIHLFQEKGFVTAEIDPQLKVETLHDHATEIAIETGAEDVEISDDKSTVLFICGASNLKHVVNELEKEANYKILDASVEYVPSKVQQLTENDLATFKSLQGKLEKLPEVVRIVDNIASL